MTNSEKKKLKNYQSIEKIFAIKLPDLILILIIHLFL